MGNSNKAGSAAPTKTVVFYTVDDDDNETGEVYERLSEAKKAAREDGLVVRTRRQ